MGEGGGRGAERSGAGGRGEARSEEGGEEGRVVRCEGERDVKSLENLRCGEVRRRRRETREGTHLVGR